MRWLRFLFVAGLAVLAQTTVLRALSFGDARPDLMVACLVALCVGVRGGEGFAVGCVLGLGRDLFSTGPLGLSAAVFAVLGYALARLRPGLYAQHPLTHCVLGFACSVVSSSASVAALWAQGTPLAFASAARRAATIALATGVLSAVVGGVVWRRPRWLGLRRRLEFQDV